MTDKEQALVVAADVCEQHQVAASDAPYEIRDLTPADAEKHLRALMMEVAVKTAEKYWSHPANENIVAIVEEVLNGHS